VSGKPRWFDGKDRRENQAARDSGLDIRPQYPYIAGGTALASSLPPWSPMAGCQAARASEGSERRSRIKAKWLQITQTGKTSILIFRSGGESGSEKV
jgi:hypothetical protein